MLYSMSELLNCLKQRMEWYEKSIKMMIGEVEWENGYDFPSGIMPEWIGATRELQNTINMMEAKS